MSSSQTSSNPRLGVQGPWSAPLEGLQDAQFLRSWFEYDSSEYDSAGRSSRLSEPSRRTAVNWNLVVGILLPIGLSVGFWAGAAWLVARFWK